MNGITLFMGMFFGAVGLAFFTYGKKQKVFMPLLTGVILFVIPYMITNLYLLIAIGILVCFIPYLIRF